MTVDSNVEEDMNEVVLFGDINLSEDKIELINLGPNFMVTSNLSSQDMRIESNVTMTKIRLGRSSKGQEMMTDSEVLEVDAEEDEDIVEEMRMMEEEMRDVLLMCGTRLCMGCKWAMDMKNNRQVKMPGPAPAHLEATYTTCMGVWQSVHDGYMKDTCKESGEQMELNLSPNQMLAMKSLKRKIAKMEVLVMKADKEGKFVCMDQATYGRWLPTTPTRIRWWSQTESGLLRG